MAKARRSGDPLERAREAGLDSLFGVHPKGFVAARNAVADALKKSGDPEAAGAVRALQRPTVPVWVVNQLARRAKADLEALIDVSERLRKAQLDTLKGKASDFRGLTEKHRELLNKLRAVAAEVLELGPTATNSNLDRAQATLLAAAAGTEAQQALLLRGELREELAPPGFDLFGAAAASLPIAPPAKSPPKKEKPPPGESAQERKQREAAEAKAEKARQEEEARQQKERAAEAERKAQRDAAERAVAAEAQRVQRAEAAHAAAEEALAQAKERETEAREGLKAAQADHRAAEAKLKKLEAGDRKGR